MTLLGGQIGRTLMKNVLSVKGGGGTGGVGSDHGKHELLGRMHVDVCEGKAMEDSIRCVCQVWVIIICTNMHSYRIQRRHVEIFFVQQIAGGDTLLEFQTTTTSSYWRPISHLLHHIRQRLSCILCIEK